MKSQSTRFVLTVLVLLTRVACAQDSILIVTGDRPAMRVYDLDGADRILIRQVPKLTAGVHRCPVCVKQKLSSRVYLSAIVIDSVSRASLPYYDEKGKILAGDENPAALYLYCGRKHYYREAYRGTKKTVAILSN